MRLWHFPSSVKLILQTRMRSHPEGTKEDVVIEHFTKRSDENV